MSDETTTDTLAEIEGQAEQPVQIREGRWRTRNGEIRNVTPTPEEHHLRSSFPWWDASRGQTYYPSGRYSLSGDHPLDLVEYLGPIQPHPEPEPEPEPQPVQIREGRWRTRGGEVKNIKPCEPLRGAYYIWPWTDGIMTFRDNGLHEGRDQSVNDLVEYLGPIEPDPEPDRIITPDDVAAEALAGVNDWPTVQTLRRKLETTEAALLEQQQRNEQLVTQGSQQRMQIAELQAQVNFLKGRELTLGTRLQDEKAVSTKRLQQVEELRSEVSHVQRLWGESRRRVEELETLAADLRAVNAATERAVNSAALDKADLESRLRAVAAEFGVQLETNNRLETQLEAVKAELVRQCENSRLLQIELDAREQVPQAVSDRFEEGWDAGTARAVETIAEWLEPLRKLIDAADNVEQTERASNLAADIMQNLPHIMRTLTGLTDED